MSLRLEEHLDRAGSVIGATVYDGDFVVGVVAVYDGPAGTYWMGAGLDNSGSPRWPYVSRFDDSFAVVVACVSDCSLKDARHMIAAAEASRMGGAA